MTECKHGNTITNECSDCNEQELKDYHDNSFSCDITVTQHCHWSFVAENEEQFIQTVKDKWLEDYNYELEDEHITMDRNEYSEDTLKDFFLEKDILDYALSEVYNMLIGTHNIITDIIDDYQKYGGMVSDEIKNKVEKEILNRLQNGE